MKIKTLTIILLAISAITGLGVWGTTYWSERAIVTVSLGSVNTISNYLLSDGNNYYANIYMFNSGKSSGDFTAIITATNAQVSIDKKIWSSTVPIHMTPSPNTPPNSLPIPIYIKPNINVNTISIELSIQHPLISTQEVSIVNLSSLTYNMTGNSGLLVSYS